MTTLKGIFPDPKPARRKNFIQENVKSLRKMEQYFHNNKNIEDLKNLHIHKQQKVANKYQNVTSKLIEASNKSSSHINKTEKLSRSYKKLSASDLYGKEASSSKELLKVPERYAVYVPKKIDQSRLNQKSLIKQSKIKPAANIGQGQCQDSKTKKTVVKFRSQGIQTVDDKKLESLYSEGIIRYATMKGPSKTSADESVIVEKRQSNSTSDRGDCKSPANNESARIDFVKLNKERTAVGNKVVSILNNTVPPASYRKGVVPKYIQERKEALKKEEKAKIEAAIPSDCPAGHVPIPNEERKATLRMLRKSYEECIAELNKLPIRTDTLRAQRQKMEIERQLMKLEEGIKVFSRPKVFIQVDA